VYVVKVVCKIGLTPERGEPVLKSGALSKAAQPSGSTGFGMEYSHGCATILQPPPVDACDGGSLKGE
jgi:hypothetical protein